MIMMVIMITLENLALCVEYLPQVYVVVFFIVDKSFLRQSSCLLLLTECSLARHACSPPSPFPFPFSTFSEFRVTKPRALEKHKEVYQDFLVSPHPPAPSASREPRQL